MENVKYSKKKDYDINTIIMTVTGFLVTARTIFCPDRAVFDWFMWFMSDANDCCACDSAHTNWEREREQRLLPRALSLGLFTPGHFMCFLWSDRLLSDREKKLDKCKCICLLKSHMYILLLPKWGKTNVWEHVIGYMTCNSQMWRR